MKVLVACAVLSVGVSMGGEKEHLALAKEYCQLVESPDHQEEAEYRAWGIFRRHPTLEERNEEVMEAIYEFVISEEFVEKRARMYMEIFTEEELKQMVKVLKLPGYELLNSKWKERRQISERLKEEIVSSKRIAEILRQEDEKIEEMLKSGEVPDLKVVDKGIGKLIEKLAEAENVEELSKLVCNSWRVAPLMKDYYADDWSKWKRPRVSKREYVGYRDRFFQYDLELEDFSWRSAVFEKIDDRYVLDWESWVGYSEIPWKEFKEKKPTKPFVMRAKVEYGRYHNFGFQDEERWECLKLISPDGEEVIFGYFEVDSDVSKDFQEVMEGLDGEPIDALTLRIRYPEDGKAGNQVLITEVMALGWVAR